MTNKQKLRTLRYAGFAEESKFREDPAPSGKIWVNIASASLDPPSDPVMSYEGGLGRDATNYRPGFYAPEGDVVYAIDIRTIGFFLKWALGAYKFTEGGEGKNTHEIWGADSNTLPSFCSRLGKDLFEHVISGCTINSLELEVEDEYCMATVSITAAKDAMETLKELETIQELLPVEYPLNFIDFGIKTKKKDGAEEDISVDVKSTTLTINNNVDAETGRSLGSRFPRRIRAGNREITFSHNMWYDSYKALQDFWGSDGGPHSTEGPREFQERIVFDSGDYGSGEIILPRCIYTGVPLQPSGRDEIVPAVEGRAYRGTVELDNGEKKETAILARIKNEENDMKKEEGEEES